MSGDNLVKNNVGILTVSDRCSRGERQDASGDNLVHLITTNSKFKGNVVVRKTVPDDLKEIQNILIQWCDELKIPLILTTGGTGLSPRDVTPEATKGIIEKEATGISMAMMKGSLDITPLAMLSRSVSGVRGQSLIVNFPGSKKGSEECLLLIIPALSHAVSLIRDEHAQINSVHNQLNNDHHHHCHHHHHHHHCSHSQEAKVKESNVEEFLCNPEKVARRQRHSPFPAIPVSDAQEIVLKEAATLPIRSVNYKDALGKILSQDIYAKEPLPPFPASIKDGYAVIASDGAGLRKVIGNSIAGSESNKVKITSGCCMRINTGAPIPPGADAVIQVEDTELTQEDDEGKTELEIKISSVPVIGQDIRPIGNDIKQGQQVLNAGIKLGPSELGLLASVGVTEVPVYGWPTIAILSTGNELMEPGKTLLPGHIRDSNKTTLLSLLQHEGFPTVDIGIAKDEPHELAQKIQSGLKSADVLITTGGVSMGDKDYLKPVLQSEFNGKIHFGRVFMKPGLPSTFATVPFSDEKANKIKKIVFSLPGNPVSATVTCHLLVLPALRKMMGCPDPMPTKIKAKLVSDIHLDSRPEFHRAWLKWSDEAEMFTAQSTGLQMSSRLMSMMAANSLMALPPRTDEITVMKAGSLINVFMI